MNLKRCVISFVILFATTHLSSQIIYVTAGGTGSGSSWQDSEGSLINALSAATPGTAIWVAEGTYFPVNCSPCTDADRDISFEIKDSVALYGGFNGTETSIDQRDWEAHPTILSGDIDQNGTLENNSQTIVFTRHVTNATIVDGFTITDGNADLSAAALGHRKNSGAGWFNDGQLNGFSSHPTIRNCRFINNSALGFGGGIYNDAGFNGAASPALENCTFSGNYATYGGGGVFNQANFSGTCNATFENCTFHDNQCDATGGGVLNHGAENGICSPAFNNCLFYNNSSGVSGGGIENVGRNGNSSPFFSNCTFDSNHSDNGGGMYNDASSGGLCLTQLENCVFINNTSATDGGGMFNLGSDSGVCDLIITDCLFENNHSAFAGGGIFNNGIEGQSNPVVTNCKFIANIADTYGGGVYNLGKNGESSPEFTNCLFAKNTGSSAGGMYNLGSESGNSSPAITNCTFYGNTANVGGAVYNNANDATGNASPVIVNTIFWKNQSDFGAVFRNIHGTPDISYSVVDEPDCFSLNNGINSDVTCGAGMIYNEYPLFEDTLLGDFRLKEASPAIDAGSNIAINNTGLTIDLDHQLRIYNGIVDVGAYENSGTYFPPQVLQNPSGAMLCDGQAANLEILASGTPPLTYQWLFGGNEIAGANNNTYQIPVVTEIDEGAYSCLVISSVGDTTSSDAAFLEVHPMLTPGIEITATTTNSCEGELLEFIAFTEHEGTSPTYQWLVNGVPTGLDSFYFSSTSLIDGDLVQCRLTSSENCLTENPVTSEGLEVSVAENLEAFIEIEASALEICEGENVVFNTLTINAGDNPQFEWLLNGNSLSENGSELNLEGITDGDIIQCILNSSENCIINNPVTSNELQITVTGNLEADIMISGPDSTFCLGTEVFFTAAIQNGGLNPQFDWQINGTSVNVQEDQFNSSELTDGDVITCLLTSSEQCVAEETVSSNMITVSVDSCLSVGVLDPLVDAGVQIFPNPSRGDFFIQFDENPGLFKLEIVDMQGRLVHRENLFSSSSTSVFIQTESLARGLYLVRISNESFSFCLKKVIQ